MVIFDGHNDVLSKLRDAGGVSQVGRFLEESEFDVDVVKARKGHLVGGFFAMWVESETEEDFQSMMSQDSYDVLLPPSVSLSNALVVVVEQAAILLKLERLGALNICKNMADLESSLLENKLAAIMHLEGCEAIDSDLGNLDVLYSMGLRSLGPVWSRNNIFGDGVPFKFPSSPDIGSGLTSAGMDLVKRCNELGVLLDVSHMNLKGFIDVAKQSSAPIVATHSNVHVLCKHARNLTDEQLATIRASNGLVGLNFATAFLRADGKMLPDVSVEQMLRHLDYLLEALGEEGVALGSDFDGAQMPAVIDDSSGLQVLINAMQAHGYGEDLINKICVGNWIDVLRRTWV